MSSDVHPQHQVCNHTENKERFLYDRKNLILDQTLASVSGKELLSIPWYVYNFVPEYDPYCTNEYNCLPILFFVEL